MDLTATIFEVIDMRSFSNLWYWIALAVVWSSAAHWVLGIPYDMIQRARRDDQEAMADLGEITRVTIKRMLFIADTAGLWLLGFTSFMLTGLGILAFVYWVEFAQAVFLLGFPMSIVGAMTLATASRIAKGGVQGPDLIRALLRHRFFVQLVGIVAIFVTAMWGMYENLSGFPS